MSIQFRIRIIQGHCLIIILQAGIRLSVCQQYTSSEIVYFPVFLIIIHQSVISLDGCLGISGFVLCQCLVVAHIQFLCTDSSQRLIQSLLKTADRILIFSFFHLTDTKLLIFQCLLL